MSLVIRDLALQDVLELFDEFPIENKWIVSGAVAGGMIGGQASMELTDQLRSEFGLGGTLFGLYVLTPVITVSSATIGGCVGGLAERKLKGAFGAFQFIRGLLLKP